MGRGGLWRRREEGGGRLPQLPPAAQCPPVCSEGKTALSRPVRRGQTGAAASPGTQSPSHSLLHRIIQNQSFRQISTQNRAEPNHSNFVSLPSHLNTNFLYIYRRDFLEQQDWFNRIIYYNVIIKVCWRLPVLNCISLNHQYDTALHNLLNFDLNWVM